MSMGTVCIKKLFFRLGLKTFTLAIAIGKTTAKIALRLLLLFLALRLKILFGASITAHKNYDFPGLHQALKDFSSINVVPQWHLRLSIIRERLLFLQQL